MADIPIHVVSKRGLATQEERDAGGDAIDSITTASSSDLPSRAAYRAGAFTVAFVVVSILGAVASLCRPHPMGQVGLSLLWGSAYGFGYFLVQYADADAAPADRLSLAHSRWAWAALTLLRTAGVMCSRLTAILISLPINPPGTINDRVTYTALMFEQYGWHWGRFSFLFCVCYCKCVFVCKCVCVVYIFGVCYCVCLNLCFLFLSKHNYNTATTVIMY